jgi:signal transduction histidine kinase
MFGNLYSYFAVLLMGLMCSRCASAQSHVSLASLSLTQIEERLEEVDTELSSLAHYSLRSGVGAIGYRSVTYTNSTNTESVQVDLGAETPIDQVVLVPTIWRDTEVGFVDDGFPAAFTVIVGKNGDPNGLTIASFTQEDGLLPRIAPLIISCSGVTASWVRIEATELTKRHLDGAYIFQLSELLVFNGPENVALRQPITTSTIPPRSRSRASAYLVDGFTPYLMDAAHGDQSLAFVNQGDAGDTPALTVDLGSSQPLTAIHLHAVDQSDTVPQANVGDFGIPKRLLVEGANQPDFSDAAVLLDYTWNSIYDVGPIMMLPLQDSPCRYVRLTAFEPYQEGNISKIGFAEIELISKGRNIAVGRPINAKFTGDAARTLDAFTDGRNLYGNILPIRDWMDELAKRHDLESERPVIAAELQKRYDRQKTNLRRMGWLATILGVGILVTVLLDRIFRMRHVAKIKERFAADLHDELGANIHTIGLLSDCAQESEDSPADRKMLMQRIRELTERTGTAIRHCTNMLEASALYIGLAHDMRRAANRIITNFEHDFSIIGESFLERLPSRTRIDLFLFYKECLVNICRHAKATKIKTSLVATSKNLILTISDNGTGLTEPPNSLKRRARLLGAKLTVESHENAGTNIVLEVKNRKWNSLKPIVFTK